MTVYLAWTSERDGDDLVGPWEELRVAAPGLLLISSTESLSHVYHGLKWALPEGVALVVAPVERRPKLTGLRPGTQDWLRARLPG